MGDVAGIQEFVQRESQQKVESDGKSDEIFEGTYCRDNFGSHDGSFLLLDNRSLLGNLLQWKHPFPITMAYFNNYHQNYSQQNIALLQLSRTLANFRTK